MFQVSYKKKFDKHNFYNLPTGADDWNQSLGKVNIMSDGEDFHNSSNSSKLSC